jgi:hypothetical protein
MALPSTGPISLANVNVELGLSSTTAISLNQTNVRTLAGVASGTISMADLRGKSNVTFSPDGGTTVGSAVYVNSDVAYAPAEVTIGCSVTAVWTWTKTSGSDAYVSVATGGSSGSIFFQLDAGSGIATAQYSLSATAGGVTRYWTIDLRSEYV